MGDLHAALDPSVDPDMLSQGAAVLSDAQQSTTRAKRSAALTVFTNSELQTFRDCAQKHDFAYRQRLRPLVEGKALAVGSIFHDGMRDGIRAGWAPGWKSTPNPVRLENQITAAVLGIDGLVGRWAAKIVEHSEVASVDYERLATEVDETAAMVKWMLAHYFRQTARDLVDLVLIEAERAFRVPIRAKDGSVRHLYQAGVRDAAFFDPAYNAVVLAEHKTCSSAPRDIEKRAEMDPQTTGYVYALREGLAAGELVTVDGEAIGREASVARFHYNALRKSSPKTPKVNQDGTVSVAAIDTTPAMYQAALDEQAHVRKISVTPKQVELYQRLVDGGDRYFARVEYHRTDAEIERWRSETFVDAARVREADRDPTRRTRNSGHCNMPWSMKCVYRSICLDPKAPELRTMFRVTDDPHGEVRAAEAEEGVA